MDININRLPRTRMGICILIVTISLIAAFLIAIFAEGEGLGNAPFIVYPMFAGGAVLMAGLVNLMAVGFEVGASSKKGDFFVLSAISAWILAAFFSLLSISQGYFPSPGDAGNYSKHIADIIRYAAFGFGVLAFSRAGRC